MPAMSTSAERYNFAVRTFRSIAAGTTRTSVNAGLGSAVCLWPQQNFALRTFRSIAAGTTSTSVNAGLGSAVCLWPQQNFAVRSFFAAIKKVNECVHAILPAPARLVDRIRF